jgi:hypothetical protein
LQHLNVLKYVNTFLAWVHTFIHTLLDSYENVRDRITPTEYTLYHQPKGDVSRINAVFQLRQKCFCCQIKIPGIEYTCCWLCIYITTENLYLTTQVLSACPRKFYFYPQWNVLNGWNHIMPVS